MAKSPCKSPNATIRRSGSTDSAAETRLLNSKQLAETKEENLTILVVVAVEEKKEERLN